MGARVWQRHFVEKQDNDKQDAFLFFLLLIGTFGETRAAMAKRWKKRDWNSLRTAVLRDVENGYKNNIAVKSPHSPQTSIAVPQNEQHDLAISYHDLPQVVTANVYSLIINAVMTIFR